MNINNMPVYSQRQLLLDDIRLLGYEVNTLFGSHYPRIRFDVMTSNKCPKFQIDHVAVRLLNTYWGFDTEYSFFDDQNQPTEIFTLPECSAFALRGTKWPTDCTNNLVHRSPEIYDEDETRLLLVIAFVDDAEG